MRKAVIIILFFVAILEAMPRKANFIAEFENRGLPRTPAEMELIAPLEDIWTGFDILSYDIHIKFNIPDRSIRASTTLTVALLDSLDTLFIDFSHLLEIDSLFVDNNPVEIISTNDSIRIPLGGIYGQGDTITVRVDYHGSPRFGYLVRQNPYAQNVYFSFSEPNDAYGWFPCHNVPYDKAIFCLTADVPLGYLVAGNGVITLDSVDVSGGRRIVRWEENYPMAPYLFSVAIYPYVLLIDTTEGGIPVHFYMYPEDTSKFVSDWAETPRMIEVFSLLFGPYPFEKYGMAEAPIMGGWGAMEHQTCTTYGDRLVDGSGRFKDVVAHELSHMWWGDMVTCGTWKDLWLNEGFATYSEALYIEQTQSFSAFRDYVAQLKMAYFSQEPREGRFPIYDPEYLWGVTVYNKAACVLDMLRYELGDSIFFEALREYGNEFKYSYAVTEDFRNVCERVSGRSLEWFFQQWIYSPGYPELDYWWSVASMDSAWIFHIDFHQTQTDAPIFRFPLEIQLTCADSVRLLRVMISNAWESFDFIFRARPLLVDIDPNSYVILKVNYRGTPVFSQHENHPGLFDLQTYPNPFNAELKIRVFVPAAGRYYLYVYDVQGRIVDELLNTELYPGNYTLNWKPGSLASGVYFLRLAGLGVDNSHPVLYIK